MNKRFLSLLIALFLFFASVVPYANATLTNGSPAVHSNVEYYSAYLTAASNDTTDPADGPVIYNLDGSVKAINASIQVTDKAGTSPTANLQIIGSNDGTNWFVVQSADGTSADIETTALDISSADSTTVVDNVSTVEELLIGPNIVLPSYLKLRCDLGGTSPGWTGTISAVVLRGK